MIVSIHRPHLPIDSIQLCQQRAVAGVLVFTARWQHAAYQPLVLWVDEYQQSGAGGTDLVAGLVESRDGKLGHVTGELRTETQTQTWDGR